MRIEFHRLEHCVPIRAAYKTNNSTLDYESIATVTRLFLLNHLWYRLSRVLHTHQGLGGSHRHPFTMSEQKIRPIGLLATYKISERFSSDR